MRRSDTMVWVGALVAVTGLRPALAQTTGRADKSVHRDAAKDPKGKDAPTPQRGGGRTPGASPNGAASGKPLSLPGQPQAARALAPPPALSPPPPPLRPFVPNPLTLPVQKGALDNGLSVVMHVDHTAPTVAVVMTYDVGGRNEEHGHTGLAHLFEHLMFQGSANVAKGDHQRLVLAHGGTVNGTSSSDRTQFFQVVPANELALALWLEADRLSSLDLIQETIDAERKAIEEEYRARITNIAYAPARIRLRELVLQGYWPYEHDTLGTPQESEAPPPLEAVKAFYGAYYAPNNAVLSLAGDFEPDEAMQLVHQYFDSAKKLDKLAAYAPPPLADPSGPRTATVEDEHAKTPALFTGWIGPAGRESDHYALEIAMALLGDGETSRLYQRLVRDRALAQDVLAWTSGHRGPDLLAIQLTLADGARLADTKKALDAEIARLTKDGPTDAELLKVRSRIDSAFVSGLQTNVERATRLGQYELFHGDARLLTGEPARYFEVTRDDVKRVMALYLAEPRRATVEVHPAGTEEATPKPVAARRPNPPLPAPAAPSLAPHGNKKDANQDKTSKNLLGKEREGGLKKTKRPKDNGR